MKNRLLQYSLFILTVILVIGSVIYKFQKPSETKYLKTASAVPALEWHAPDINQLPATGEAQMIRYGRELIANTANYLGPKGSIANMSNGMNCQNCHLDAGTRLYGNSFALVASTYPEYRDRSGRVETIPFRVNECMVRSLNGKKLDSNTKEMLAMVAYLKWVSKEKPSPAVFASVKKNQLPFLDRAANPDMGKHIFMAKCQTCHGADGAGKIRPDSGGFFFPPLWGEHSYNVSAGMYRLTRLATFVKYNMPFSVVQREPQLTDEEAWDVAAYINSQGRPEKFFTYDWSNLNTKPVDYPFGPFTDSFSAVQHKYGPFTAINKTKKAVK